MPGSGDGPGPAHLVVGLGNPGPRYGATRHNIGFRVVERLAERWRAPPWEARCQSLVARAQVQGHRVWLARPHTFMNRSGAAVGSLVAQLGVAISQVVVVHDDLDLPLGRLRLRLRGGHGGHNGMKSVLEALPSGEFVRLKVGIGRPAEGVSVVEYVLSSFAPQQEAVLSGLLERAAAVVESFVVEGPVEAMKVLSA